MSVTVDANVLVYAANEADPVHPASRELVDRLAGGPDLVYLFWPTIMAYLRIVTHPGILLRPLTPENAASNMAGLLALPHVRSPGEGHGFLPLFRTVSEDRVRGNGVPDAHLVALMRQHGVGSIYSRDRGLRAYEGIEVRDPFG